MNHTFVEKARVQRISALRRRRSNRLLNRKVDDSEIKNIFVNLELETGVINNVPFTGHASSSRPSLQILCGARSLLHFQ